MSPNNESELIFAHAVLTPPRRVPGCTILCAASGEGSRRAETDTLGENDARVVASESGGGGEFVDVTIGVEDFERKIRPGELVNDR